MLCDECSPQAAGFGTTPHAGAQIGCVRPSGRGRATIPGGEKISGKWTFRLPANVIEFASRQPLTSGLLPCDIGYSPRTAAPKISRLEGSCAFTLLFCADGFGTLDLRSGPHRVGRGMALVLQPCEVQACAADPARPWSFYWIQFNGTMAPQYYHVLTQQGTHACLARTPDAGFVPAFYHILNVYREGVGYRMLVQASTTLHQILGNLYAQSAADSVVPESAATRIERTIAVVRNNLSTHVSVHELAAVANMSPAYYTLQFRRHTGASPCSYFNKLKIAKACEYLGTTGAKIASIAQLVGYDDAFYFCRLFKQTTGRTPTEYRCGARRPAKAISPDAIAAESRTVSHHG